MALFRIVSDERPAILREAVVDTGSPMTVFPQKEWARFQHNIRWLTRPNDPTVPKWCRQFSGVAGGSFPCRLGVVSIEFYDNVGGRVGPAEIVAMFALDRGQMRDILIGLGGGTFSNRRFEVLYDTQSVSLNDI